MSSSLKYLLLVAPAALMIAILFLYPLGFSLVSAFTAPGQPFTLDHFRKVYALYASDVLFSLLIVLILSGAVSAARHYPVGSDCAVTLPTRCAFAGFFVSPAAVYSFYRCCPDDAHFLAKNGLMNNALVAADLVTPLETLSWLGWKGIAITFVWQATGLCHAADLRGDGGAGVVADPCCT